jgi:hypothetical protein
MENWLYNPEGKPVAFINGEEVYSSNGEYIGHLVGNEVLNGGYAGEILWGYLLVRDDRKPKNMPTTFNRRIPNTPEVPEYKGFTFVPLQYVDVA